MTHDFPPDFTFGVATSAYQVEGGIENDWSDWEAAGKLKDPHARCGLAVDHWNRFDADVDLIERLGGTVVACAFVIELTFLGGRDKLAGHRVASLLKYDD